MPWPTKNGKDHAFVEVGGARRQTAPAGPAVVGADGVQSAVGRSAGLRPPEEILPGYEAELAGVDCPMTR